MRAHYMSVCLSARSLPVCLPVGSLITCLSACRPAYYLSVCLSAHSLPVCLPVGPLTICLSACRPAYYLSVCQFDWPYYRFRMAWACSEVQQEYSISLLVVRWFAIRNRLGFESWPNTLWKIFLMSTVFRYILFSTHTNIFFEVAIVSLHMP
jgi:hypothetical protein